MTVKQWFNVEWLENPYQDNRWGMLHIIVLLFCAAFCVGTYFLRNKSERLRVWIIRAVAILLYHFELVRRIINISKMGVPITGLITNNEFIYNLLPRPWCAISVWLIIIAAILNKRFFYNIASMNAIICVIIFFAYPTAGFNNEIMQFENVYSIATHALLFMGAVSMITMGLTEFKYTRTKWYNSALRELIAVLLVFVYSFIEIFVLKIAEDPLYFMPTGFLAPGEAEPYVNEVQDILGFSGPLYVIGYVAFIILYFNLFYLIRMAVDKSRARKALEMPEIETAEVVES